jgi:ElaB/YqjD/DUF883 family membrane-anchored ribosome-binding protein
MSYNSYLMALEHDVNSSATEKEKTLKLLKTVLKNLADPLKASDIKYRTLKLSNPKIKSMARHAMPFLVHCCGFVQTTLSVAVDNNSSNDMEQILQIPNAPNPSSMESLLAQVTSSHERVLAQVPFASSSALLAVNSKLTEKQKARLLQERAALKDKHDAAQARARTAAQIKADKLVREQDPDWKPSVCAAAAKSGAAMQTFRDKFGE